MDSQEQALLATIRQNPGEDGARLVYADWLEERGATGRSEFIRVQIERANRDDYDPVQKALARRERELIEQHGTEWVGSGLREFAKYKPPPVEPAFEPLDRATTRELPPHPRWFFRRGFPWIELSAREFLANAEMLLDAAPLLQVHVGHDSYKERYQRSQNPSSFRPRRDLFADLLRSTELPRAAIGLTLVEESDFEQYALLGRCLPLVSLHGRWATAYGWHLRELSRAHGLARLTDLSFNWMNLTDPAVRELASCSWLPNLQTLNLRDNHLGPDGVAALTTGPAPGRLCVLDLSDNPIGDAGARHLAAWPGLTGVRVLRLEGCDIGPTGVAHLATSNYLQNLTQLGLQRNRLGGAGVAALLDLQRTEWLGRLVRLDLCGNHIGSLGARRLAGAAAFLPNLRRLFLSLDRDDLKDHYLNWLIEAFQERFVPDWFEHPH